MSQEDDYGRRRDADFNYALNGGKPVVDTPKVPAGIAGALLKGGMDQKEIAECAQMIVMSIEKMGVKAPPPEQEKTVGILIGRVATPQLVREVTNMAVDEVRQKQAFSIAPKESHVKPVSTAPTNHFKR